MPEVRAIFHRSKQSNIYPLGGDRYLIEAKLGDEVHDVVVEVEVMFPSLEVVAARSEIRNGPFTNVCNMTHVNMQKLVGMNVGRGFTTAARAAIGGKAGCHRISELIVEIAQAAYQLNFVLFFENMPKEMREREDVPIDRWRAVNQTIPGMRNTCWSYSDEREPLIEREAEKIKLFDQVMPVRRVD